MIRIAIALTLGALVTLTGLSAQSVTPAPATWGLEANVVWPFVPGVEIYNLRAARPLWQTGHLRGDLVLGAIIRPGSRQDENAAFFSEYGLGLGYRQYFWRGLHLELATYHSLATERDNFIDGGDHQGYALTTELYAGYRFELMPRRRYGLYLVPQTGVGYNPISLVGPATVASGAFPVVSLLVGVRLGQ